MFRKILVGTIISSALVVLFFTGVVMVSAQGPTNDDWTRAIYMYDRAYTMPANKDLWFRYDYAGDLTQVNITIPGGFERGLEFRVFTPEQAARYFDDDKSIGSGTAPQVACDTGRCTSPDLVWNGAFNYGATFYVKVRNPKNVPIPFRFQITGKGVSLGQDAPPIEIVSTPTPTLPLALTFSTPLPPPTTISLVLVTPIPTVALPQIPLVTATPIGAQNASPFDAIYVPDNRPQSIPANGNLWYKFGYSGDKSQINITLPNANAFGLEFRIYNSEQAARVYIEDVNTGIGTAAMVPCDSGKCASNDFTWNGSFNVSGIFYVEVINNKPIPQTFVLRISGTAIDIVGK